MAGLTFNNALLPGFGKYEVAETFGEIEIPILTDLPFIKSLSIGGAERYSHYSTAGDTNTWNAHFSWSIIPDITFRGTHAKAVRAPNVSELFDPGGQTFLFIDDPCDVNYIGKGTAFRAANCAALCRCLRSGPQQLHDPNPGTSRLGHSERQSKLRSRDCDHQYGRHRREAAVCPASDVCCRLLQDPAW